MDDATKSSKPKRKLTPGKIAYAVLILLLVVLLLYLLYARMTGAVPQLFGYSIVRIITPSMEPKIPVGSFILVKRTSPENVEPGDIITFFTDDPDPTVAGKTITHRVMSVTIEDGKYIFETKGDNTSTNPVSDKYPARGERLVGKYQCDVFVMTAFANLFEEHFGIAMLVTLLIPVILLTQYALRDATKKKPSTREEYIGKRVQEEIEKLKREGLFPPSENPGAAPSEPTEQNDNPDKTDP